MLCTDHLSGMAIRISTSRLVPEDSFISHEEWIGLDVRGRKDRGPGDVWRTGTLLSAFLLMFVFPEGP